MQGILVDPVVHTDEVAFHNLSSDFHNSQVEVEAAFLLASCFINFRTCCLRLGVRHLHNNCPTEHLLLMDDRTVHFRNQ